MKEFMKKWQRAKAEGSWTSFIFIIVLFLKASSDLNWSRVQHMETTQTCSNLKSATCQSCRKAMTLEVSFFDLFNSVSVRWPSRTTSSGECFPSGAPSRHRWWKVVIRVKGGLHLSPVKLDFKWEQWSVFVNSLNGMILEQVSPQRHVLPTHTCVEGQFRVLSQANVHRFTLGANWN